MALDIEPFHRLSVIPRLTLHLWQQTSYKQVFGFVLSLVVDRSSPFCPLLVWIGVKPRTLSFDEAVAAADAVKVILSQAGFDDFEVAFRES